MTSRDFRKLFCQLCFLYSIELLATDTEKSTLINDENIIDTTNNKFNTNNDTKCAKPFQPPTTNDEWNNIYTQLAEEDENHEQLQNMSIPHYSVKFIGEAGAGKTSIINDMLQGKKIDNFKANIEEKTYSCYVYSYNTHVPFAKLTIIDSVGYKDDNDWNKNFINDMNNVDAVVIVCDMSKKNYDINTIEKFFPLQKKPHVLLIVANKYVVVSNHDNLAKLSDFCHREQVQKIVVNTKTDFNMKTLLINILNQLFDYNNNTQNDHLWQKQPRKNKRCNCCPCNKDKEE